MTLSGPRFKPELKCFSEQGPRQHKDPIRAGGFVTASSHSNGTAQRMTREREGDSTGSVRRGRRREEMELFCPKQDKNQTIINHEMDPPDSATIHC